MNVIFDTSRFEAREKNARLDTCKALVEEARNITLEYQRQMARLAREMKYETGLDTSKWHEEFDSHLYDAMDDTFNSAASKLEEML